jgi:hypothetical protein
VCCVGVCGCVGCECVFRCVGGVCVGVGACVDVCRVCVGVCVWCVVVCVVCSCVGVVCWCVCVCVVCAIFKDNFYLPLHSQAPSSVERRLNFKPFNKRTVIVKTVQDAVRW